MEMEAKTEGEKTKHEPLMNKQKEEHNTLDQGEAAKSHYMLSRSVGKFAFMQ